MKIAIVGEPQSGKSTLISLLMAGEQGRRGKHDYEAVVEVPDARLDWLSEKYQPKKTTRATLEFIDLGADPKNAGLGMDGLLAHHDTRPCDCLALVVDVFSGGADAASAVGSMELSASIADLDLVERRLEKLRADRTRGLKESEAEIPLLERLHEHLMQEKPLRSLDLSEADRSRLRGYQFLTLKPVLVVANVAEDAVAAPADEALRNVCAAAHHELCVLAAPIEAELAAMDEEERREFMADLGIERPAAYRFLRAAYASLGLISFLTAGPDECRAWTVGRGATAPEAAGKIHSDLQRGFIRAEVVAFEDLKQHGDIKVAKSAGAVRLEGKEYVVVDGDVMEIRFSV